MTRPPALLLLIVAITLFSTQCLCMSSYLRKLLREESRNMFHHGFDAYMKYSFPDDEIRPLTCTPHVRDSDPSNFGVNDVLGNYSLTAIDSLATIALLSHSSKHSQDTFWITTQKVVELYWPRGFDRDSKVQLFETVIRGVGGLLSAHEFAIGSLPMGGKARMGVDGWVYNDELLWLAHDLATRLLPAFDTPTGIPYPRVNLKYGSVNRPLAGKDAKEKYAKPPKIEGFTIADDERTDTCSAGAGSLTLEFTVLSRLLAQYKETHKSLPATSKQMWHDVGVFERVSHAAFWAIWDRRSRFDLVGGGIDAITGLWESNGGALAGIGASTDSFFEYALKTYILLSSSPSHPSFDGSNLNEYVESFLDVFTDSVEAINRHLMVETPTVYYQGVNMNTGAPMGGWVDSLGAFWPGLLVLGGSVSAAEKSSLFYTALWQRHHAIPERYSPLQHSINLPWWPGRPEFIESIYHIYRATKDIWYLRVGEMVLRDIQRRCWGRCGWGGLQDVRTGEVVDRMESFTLSETLGYLFLLFDEENPIHKGDAPWVFTTEGHPLIMPKLSPSSKYIPYSRQRPVQKPAFDTIPKSTELLPPSTCENPHYNKPAPDLWSITASRSDIFHSYELMQLHLFPGTVKTPRTPTNVKYYTPENVYMEHGYYNHLDEDNPYRFDEVYSPTNSTFYPWTLPYDIVSPSAYCAITPGLDGFELVFPAAALNDVTKNIFPSIVKIPTGIHIQSLSGLRLGFIKEPAYGRGKAGKFEYRLRKVGAYVPGKEEVVAIDKRLLKGMTAGESMEFTMAKETENFDIILDYSSSDSSALPEYTAIKNEPGILEIKVDGDLIGEGADILEQLQQMLANLAPSLVNPTAKAKSKPKSTSNKLLRRHLQAIPASGIGAVRPAISDPVNTPGISPTLPFKSIYAAGHACEPVDTEVMNYEVIILRRGSCPFAQKLNNIATSPLTKLAIVVSYDDDNPAWNVYQDMWDEEKGLNDVVSLHDNSLITPLVDKAQTEPPMGYRRRTLLPLVLVGGGERTYEILKRAKGLGLRERYKVELGKLGIVNMVAVA